MTRWFTAFACSLALAPTPALHAALLETTTESFLGTIELPGIKLDFDIDLKRDDNGAWVGDISIPAQQAKDIALVDLVVEGDSITFGIEGVPGQPLFRGKRVANSDRVEGKFSQNGATFPFSMEKKGQGAAAAKSALADFATEFDQARAAVEALGAAIVVVKDDEIVFLGAAGRRNVEKDLPATPQTLFAIGSSTKAFTAFVLGTLVDEGKLAFDEPVKKWLPEFQLHDSFASDRMTPRDLLTHRSGLPRHDLLWYLQSSLSRADMVSRLRYLEPSKDFRTTFQYNNLMFLTAGYLEEKVTGSRWEDLVRDRILGPLGMRRTNFSVTTSQQDPDHALPYGRLDGKTIELPFHPLDHVGPAGSINSSVEEMTQWIRLQLSDGTLDGKKLISSSTLADMHVPHMIMASGDYGSETRSVGYGLGWFVDEFRGVRRFHHGGHIDGFSSLVSFVPAERIGIAVLVNQSGSALNELAVQLVLDRLLPDTAARPADKDRIGSTKQALTAAENAAKTAQEKKETARKQGTSPSHPLADYSGDYDHPGYGRAKIALANDTLSLTFGDVTTNLRHVHYDVFETTGDSRFEGVQIQFVGDFEGDISTLRWSIEPAVETAVFFRAPETKLLDPSYLAKFEGDYSLKEQTAKVTLHGKTLSCSVPGQPTFELKPVRDDTFELEGITGYRIQFTRDSKGAITGADFIQPDGIHHAKKK